MTLCLVEILVSHILLHILHFLLSVPKAPKVTKQSISCQTVTSWVTDTQMPPPSQTRSSASQTKHTTLEPPEPASEPTSEQEVETSNQQKKKKRNS